MKRFFGILFSLLALALLSPLLLGSALAVLLESGRPVFFRQVRVGMEGREFGMLKFRSMVKNAAVLGTYQTAVDDPRITGVGRFLRRTSLDELPQLLNVLKGEMSVVGPRPDVPEQRQGYTAAQWEERHRVRPGITGLAQVLYRSAAVGDQRLEADLLYVREASLWLDLKVIFWTLGRLAGKGSN